MFVKPIKISLLNFIGAADYFITEFGAIWTRKKVYPNKFNILTRGYLPLVIKDRSFPYPWVYLPTTAGKIWFPVNQLLGWAFVPQDNKEKSFFLSKYPGISPQMLEHYSWEKELPHQQIENSVYVEFMNQLYG